MAPLLMLLLRCALPAKKKKKKKNFDIWEAGKNNFEPKATGVNLLRLF